MPVKEKENVAMINIYIYIVLQLFLKSFYFFPFVFFICLSFFYLRLFLGKPISDCKKNR